MEKKKEENNALYVQYIEHLLFPFVLSVLTPQHFSGISCSTLSRNNDSHT